MKRYIGSTLVLCLFLSSSLSYAQVVGDQEFVNAHAWMYAQDMTKYEQVKEFQPDALVTREQAAKFFVAFDRVVMGREAETMMYCVYSDEASFDPTLAGAIQSACNRNLMRGSDDLFGAKAYLTKAQALTILIRSLSGTQDEQVTPWWSNYFVVAQQKKLTKETNVYALDKPLTRYELALLLWRVENPLLDKNLQDIHGLLQELGLQTE